MLKIKVHDVMHDRGAEVPSDFEGWIESYLTDGDVVNVRIASGDRNSPLFVTLDTQRVSVDRAMDIARNVVSAFGEQVDGVDVDRVVREDNVLIIQE